MQAGFGSVLCRIVEQPKMWVAFAVSVVLAVLVVAVISLVSPPSLLEQHPNWPCENVIRARDQVSDEIRAMLCSRPEWVIGD